ncbi:hypothetical protein [Actinophytocola sp.]|uniref:hypothetical protein n=1 Tax=Actinophytocola sp. TaxID=1872138 RepID=UPI00389A5009
MATHRAAMPPRGYVAAGRVAEAIAAAVPIGAPVVACLLGMAGASKFTDPAIQSKANRKRRRAWRVVHVSSQAQRVISARLLNVTGGVACPPASGVVWSAWW